MISVFLSTEALGALGVPSGRGRRPGSRAEALHSDTAPTSRAMLSSQRRMTSSELGAQYPV